MRLAITADQHVGNHTLHGGPLVAGLNSRCRQHLECLSASIATARSVRADAYVGAGDLFDSVDPAPPVVAAVRRMLARFERPVHLILGNHEIVSDEPGASSTEVLGCLESDNVRVHRTPHQIGHVLLVPHDPRVPSLEAVRMAVEAVRAPDIRLIVGHFGIYDDTDAEYLKGDRSIHIRDLDGVLARTIGEGALVVAGDWHRHRMLQHGGTRGIQVGALCPRGWTDEGPEGYGSILVVEVESRDVRRHEVEGPRFLRGTEEEVQAAARAIRAQHAGADQIFVRLEGDGAAPEGSCVVERPPSPRHRATPSTRRSLTLADAVRSWCRSTGRRDQVAERAIELVRRAKETTS